MTVSLSEATAVVTQYIFKEIPDALMKSNALWKLSLEQKEFIDGGDFIQFAIKVMANTSSNFINGTNSVIDTNQSIQLQRGILNWKYFVTPVSITLDDITKTGSSPRAIKSLMDAKKEGAKADAIRQLTQALHNSSTVNPLSFDGLADAIAAASGTAYAGLLDTDFPDATAYLPVQDSATTSITYSAIEPAIAQVRGRLQQDGVTGLGYKLDYMISSSYTQAKFKQAEQLKQRFINVSEGSPTYIGFDAINVDGINWYIDEFTSGSRSASVADNYLYLLTSKSMKLFYRFGLDKASPLDGDIRLPSQPIISTQTFFVGNMAVVNRRVNGVFKTLQA